MRFEIGDETDQALTTTLVHEMFLCATSFERFVHLAQLNIMGRRDKEAKILCHDAYASFLHHLFEFYAGCIQRDLMDTRSVDSRHIDHVLNTEARKLLKNKVDAIKDRLCTEVGESYLCVPGRCSAGVRDTVPQDSKSYCTRKHQAIHSR
jgi:hypothetical protein